MMQERVIGESVLAMSPPKDPAVNLLENYFTYELLRVCDLGNVDLDFPVQITVINDPQINAFATSGSFIFIYTGILKQLTDVSEIMGVLCHELTHTHKHHIRRQFEQMSDMNDQKTLLLATLPLIILFPGAGELIYGMAIDQTVIQQLSFSQQMEYEADEGGLHLMRASGFDDTKLITAFESIGRYHNLDHLPSYFSYYATHPLTRNRIDRIKYHQKNHISNPEVFLQRAQLDYTLLLSELYPSYHENEHLIGDTSILDEYQSCRKSDQYQKMSKQYPESLVLRMRRWNELRAQKNWSGLQELRLRYQSDPYWSLLPIVIEGCAEMDFEQKTNREFIRQYQQNLMDPFSSITIIKYLAQAYAKNQQQGFFHLAQARYFLLKGDYTGALKELRSTEIDPDSLYTQALIKEAKMKWNIHKSLG